MPGRCCLAGEPAPLSTLHIAICAEVINRHRFTTSLQLELAVIAPDAPSPAAPPKAGAEEEETVALFIHSPEEVPYAEIACPTHR